MEIFKISKNNDLEKEKHKTQSKDETIVESYICEKCGIRYEICKCACIGDIEE